MLRQPVLIGSVAAAAWPLRPARYGVKPALGLAFNGYDRLMTPNR